MSRNSLQPVKLTGAFLLSLAAVLALYACAATPRTQPAPDPLPSWNAGPVKQGIVSFVQTVTDPESPSFVPSEERIAVFDNDGTLWSEQPMYFQLAFMLDRIRALAAEHPEWKDQMPFKAVLENDLAALAATGEHGLMEIAMAAQTGMTTEEFDRIVSSWIRQARHPRYDQPYNAMVFQPMLEVLDYLRANGFATWIVSGGGIAFMRPWTQETYGIPPEQVVGSSIDLRFEMRDDGPVMVREPKIDFVNDKAGKPVGIQRHIGQRPLAAFGNSDGDLQMLQWTAAGDGPRLMVLVHHTDAEREWAYDRESHIGQLDKALDEAVENQWLVIDMAKDWREIYPFQLQ